MAEIYLKDMVTDVTTSLTSLVGAVAGAASANIGDYLLVTLMPGGNKRDSLGSLGISFVVQATVSAVCFGVAASFVPNTSNNIFFSILFFAGDQPLVQVGATIGHVAVRTVANTIKQGIGAANGGGLPMAQKSASCAGCSKPGAKPCNGCKNH